MVAETAEAPGPPLPHPRSPLPKSHLLGLQEIGVPQLADDHLTLLKRGGLAQVGGQAHQGGCPCHLLALVLAARHRGGLWIKGLHFFISETVIAAAQRWPARCKHPPPQAAPSAM